MRTMSRAEPGAAAARGPLWRAVFVCAALAGLLALGTWQVQRLGWKTGLIAAREASLARPPVALSGIARARIMPAFRRVRVSGEFLHDKEILLGPRTRSGAAGWHVITPLRLTGGGVVLVNRGWVPHGRKDPATRRAGLIRGPVRVEGLLRVPSAPGRFTPDNVPAKGDWYHVDIAAMASHLGLDDVAPYLIDAGPNPNPGGLPVGGQTIVRPPNNHLVYALTWYALAVVLLAIYIIDRRGRRRQQ